MVHIVFKFFVFNIAHESFSFSTLIAPNAACVVAMAKITLKP